MAVRVEPKHSGERELDTRQRDLQRKPLTDTDRRDKPERPTAHPLQLSEYFSNHPGRLDPGQSGRQSTEIMSEPLVIYAKQMQDGRLEVADVNRILNDVV